MRETALFKHYCAAVPLNPVSLSCFFQYCRAAAPFNPVSLLVFFQCCCAAAPLNPVSLLLFNHYYCAEAPLNPRWFLRQNIAPAPCFRVSHPSICSAAAPCFLPFDSGPQNYYFEFDFSSARTFGIAIMVNNRRCAGTSPATHLCSNCATAPSSPRLFLRKYILCASTLPPGLTPVYKQCDKHHAAFPPFAGQAAGKKLGVGAQPIDGCETRKQGAGALF